LVNVLLQNCCALFSPLPITPGLGYHFKTFELIRLSFHGYMDPPNPKISPATLSQYPIAGTITLHAHTIASRTLVSNLSYIEERQIVPINGRREKALRLEKNP
jgi:hypothetical protein